MPRTLYSLLLYLLLPFIPIKLLWRGIRQPEYLRHWHERFGFYGSRRPNDAPLIWLHCVSVGETRAAEPLVHELQRRFSQHVILITHGTPTGWATSEQLFGNTIQRTYLPYDLPGATRRFLRHYQPRIGLLLETELWFNLIAECKRNNVPLLLANARLSRKSADGYSKIARLANEGLQALRGIAAQTEVDAQRLRNLGASHVEVFGNLKFDVHPAPLTHEKGASLRNQLGADRPVFLAASTRDGEEAMILDAVARLTIPGLITVIVPRHPQRFFEVASLLDGRGLKYVRRSALQSERARVSEEVSFVLGDSMGEMFVYYASSDVAFIGGSLLPFGGQNLIEAATMGKPLIIGPYTYNFEEIAEQAVSRGAALRVADTPELQEAIQNLMQDATLRSKMGEASLEFSRSAGGTAVKIADMVQPYLFST
ncbi:MAG TPA: lipid IV(A) 3-deoxy-D-manno-octulosonic acid transferase [Methylophilaceae bacterium]|nr:lipid IV(A) 3-deoxy-D-manno-octulosonic acid transferase [Methylophilaceae bacterium]